MGMGYDYRTDQQCREAPLRKRIAELEGALKEIVSYGLTTPLGVEPTADHYRRCCHDLIGIAARGLGDE